jgi:hypothetical protein
MQTCRLPAKKSGTEMSSHIMKFGIGLRRDRATVLSLRGGDPVDDLFVLLDFPVDLHLGGEHTRPGVFHVAPSRHGRPASRESSSHMADA